MNRDKFALILRLITLIIISCLAGILIIAGKFWCSISVCLILCLSVIDLFGFYRCTTRETRKFINAIRFFEGNILFDHSVSKGLDPELAEEMGKAIRAFSERMQKSQADKSFFDVMLHSLDFAIIVSDTSENIIWANKTMTDLLGTIRMKQISDLHSLSAELLDIVREIKSSEIKTVKIRHNQKEYHLAVTVTHTKIKKQTLNIYSFKNVQPIVEETEGDAWQKLISVLSHEMMNSIAPIVSLAETFGDKEEIHDPEMMQKAMETIFRRCKGLMEFVNNYRSLTHIPPLILSEFRVADMIEDITHLLKSQNILFSSVIKPKDILLTGDRAQLEQVLINLIKNGYEIAAEKEFPHVELIVTKNESGRTIITVSDNGEGIIPEVIDKIFIPFFTTKKNGSGIGLNICRQIITSHGGTIVVTTKSGKGTKFIIKL